jgi:hypothetical protein
MKILPTHLSVPPLHLVEISQSRKSFRTDPVAEIRDVVRASLLTKDLRQVPHVLASVQAQVIKRKGKLEVKNYWKTPSPLGFVGVIVKICLPIEGDLQRHILTEIQIHPKGIMDGTKECPKELAQGIYKKKGSFEIMPQELIAASQLVYLIAMRKIIRKRDNTKEIFDAFFKEYFGWVPRNKKGYFALETVLSMKRKNLGQGKFNSQLGVIIPKNPQAIDEEFRLTAAEISKSMQLPTTPIESGDYLWHNSAETVGGLYEDAKKITSSFKLLCKDAVKEHPGCTVSYGPENAHVLKDRRSLMKKMQKKAIMNGDADLDYNSYKSWLYLMLP